MKKLIILILSFSIGLTAIGQMPLPKKPNSTKRNPLPKAYHFSDWSLGFSLKSSVENILPNLVYSKAFQFHYKPKFSYEIELFVERKLDNNWVWVSGVNFHGVSFEYDHIFPITFSTNQNLIADGKFINEYDLTLDNSFQEMNFKAKVECNMFEDRNSYQDGEELNLRVSSVNTIQFLGIPLAIKKEFGHQRLRFTAKGGIEPTIITKTKIDYRRYQQSGFHLEENRANFKNRLKEIPSAELVDIEMISQTSNLKNFQLNGFINIGFIHTYKYHSFFIEAEYKRGLTAFSQKNTHTSYLNSYGFRTGFIKKFKESKIIDMATAKTNIKMVKSNDSE